ncbi:hypothetical protein E2562_001863 [Oryza meyeriana var. granulata]|uniref:Uncharacterized protein n=1 Tax=Oryza meyeriana var. granulata TaxID=110450 RepID=A0A6G1C3G2_9ORYZ|nr:hypothetical protein E2562_001863 [Oryza meyeriana var. granulata]
MRTFLTCLLDSIKRTLFGLKLGGWIRRRHSISGRDRRPPLSPLDVDDIAKSPPLPSLLVKRRAISRPPSSSGRLDPATPELEAARSNHPQARGMGQGGFKAVVMADRQQ